MLLAQPSWGTLLTSGLGHHNQNNQTVRRPKMYVCGEKKRNLHLSKTALLWGPIYEAGYSQMLAEPHKLVDKTDLAEISPAGTAGEAYLYCYVDALVSGPLIAASLGLAMNNLDSTGMAYHIQQRMAIRN